MGLWDSVITGVAQVAGTVGGAATQGSFAKQQAEIANQAVTSQTLMQTTAQLGTAGWGAVASGYLPGQALASQFGYRYQSAADIEKARIAAEAGKRNTLVVVGILALAAVVVVIVVFKR